jgi:nitroreductase
MDLAELTVSRRTVHNYTTEPVADVVVERALELSLWAPNHKLTFPWAYFWLGAKTRQRIAEFNVEMKLRREPELSDTKKRAARENVLNPSHLILLGMRKGAADAARRHEDFATLACAVQIASLYLWDQGVASKWSTGGWATAPEVYAILGISADEIQLEGALMVGHAQNVPAPPMRPPLSRFLRRME